MKIIILEDSKGFQKSVEVFQFPPFYCIAETPPITVAKIENSDISEPPKLKIIRFFPYKEIENTTNAVEIYLYTQERNA